MLLSHRQVEQAAAEEKVRGRAERDGRTGLGQARAFVVTQVHAMGEHRAFAEQMVVVVDVQITFALWKQLLDPLHLLQVFTDVGLHVQVWIFPEQLTGQGQLLGRAGGGEAWGHGVVQAALAVPALDQRLALGVARFGGVDQVVRGVAVHHHFAGDHAQVKFLGYFKNEFTDCGCTLPNTSAVVVPLRSSSLTKISATASAWVLSANWLSQGRCRC